jgi:S-DNA-T family DNA segregation ATPase FtsK/SpoIIIE
MVDTKQALPPGIDLADLQRVCTTFAWKHDHYAWFDLDFGSFPMELEAPPDAEACTSLLQLAGAEAKRAGRVEVPFELIAIPAEDWWREDSRAGISVPLGRAGATALQQLTLGKGTSQHVLIAGKTGSGKSTLLHVFIAQLAMRYSPAEVELFLIDFKKGVEFKTYATNELPHARVVAIESEREFGLSVLQRLDAELMRRGDLFRAAGVNDLPSYRNLAEPIGANGAPRPGPLPRLVLVVDEFQEFFVEDDKTSQEAALLLDRLVRQGRAFGIHILLGSQTLGGAYSLARSTIDQMAVRIALQCSETDAHLILSKDNSDARLLSRPGEAIYNAAGGLLEGNHLFQVVWLSDAKRDACLGKVRHLGRERNLWTNQIVFEGTAPADVARNTLLADALAHPSARAPRDPVQAWLGEAVAIKDPTAAIFRRQSGGNLLMIGQQDELAFSMAVAAVAGLSAQLPPFDQEVPCLQMLIAHALEGDAARVHNLLPEIFPLRLLTQRDLASTLELLNEEVNRRLKGERDGPPRFLFLHGLQRLRDLRRPDDDFGYTRKGETTVSPYKQFMNILREGPPLGVFTILWCDALANLQRTFDRQGLREFEMRVLFQMSPTDSSTLMDTPLASKLGMHRALLYTEDQGRLEKFRPYGLPSLEWMRSVARTASIGNHK